MKFKLIAIIILLSNLSLAQTELNCLKKIKESKWNYSICIDSTMGVDFTNMSEILIKQYEISESRKLTRQLSIRKSYNYNDKSSKELWSYEFGNTKFKDSRLISSTDSIFKINDNNFYSKKEIYKDQEDKIWTMSYAIGLYKSQYYAFHTMGINEGNDSYEFLLKVINRSSFFGKPVLKDDRKIKNDFLNNLIQGINDKKALNRILLNTDTFMSAAPEGEKQMLIKERSKIQLMIDRWNESANSFVEEMKDFKTVSVKNSNFQQDNSQPNVTSYFGKVIFNCDEQEISYKILSMEINGKMYLARMMKN
ncbi:hypothetical protein [uncultured Aquimarina sp.]|uniref:hypothetical protein n=1 Tax=uncultured Aquimarina sp. TaxID=575652 RepID=UPI00262E6C20|nr:hypothetical protein [uncultured Aquimarina sp.]